MEIVVKLESTKTRTLGYFDLSDRLLEQRYAKGKWSVRQILHHLADAESVLYERIRRVISEPEQSVQAFDQDLWAKHLNYAQMPVNLSRDMYLATRNRLIFHVIQNYNQKKDVVFTHSETGTKTLGEEIEKVVWHNERHLGQIALALTNAQV